MIFSHPLNDSFEACLQPPKVGYASVMLKEHVGSSFDHLGPSLVTSISPPRAARRLTVTPAGRFFELRSVISEP